MHSHVITSICSRASSLAVMEVKSDFTYDHVYQDTQSRESGTNRTRIWTNESPDAWWIEAPDLEICIGDVANS